MHKVRELVAVSNHNNDGDFGGPNILLVSNALAARQQHFKARRGYQCDSRHLHNTSSKFSNSLHSIVHAASSFAFRPSALGDSPTAMSFFASSGWAA